MNEVGRERARGREKKINMQWLMKQEDIQIVQVANMIAGKRA